MKIAIDLISDLHVETWHDPFDWSGQPTSMICVVAGDIAKDQAIVRDVLTHLSKIYRAVLYIDGNEEHKFQMENLGQSYRDLVNEINDIPGVTYLQDSVVVIDGVAFVGTNGWWTFDLDPNIDYDQSRLWYQEKNNFDRTISSAVEDLALKDFAYLSQTIQKLQTHQDVKKIVIVTHTVPSAELLDHDINLIDTWRMNCMGNSQIRRALVQDTEMKVTNWLFGHYHGDVDAYIDGIRYVNNCRGRHGTQWCRSVYYPKRIEIPV